MREIEQDVSAQRSRIVTAYERDQLDAEPALSPPELPVSYEAITIQWLTAIMCKDVPGAEVVDYTLDVRDDGTANRRRIFLEYNLAGQNHGLPSSVFCKATHDLLNRLLLGATQGALAEVTFYNTLRPRLEAEVPHAYYAGYDPDSVNSIVVLKDRANEVSFCDHLTPIGREQAEQQIALLAELHSRFRNPPADIQLLTWPELFERVLVQGHEEACRRGFQAAKAVIPKRLFKREADVWPATLEAVDIHRHLPQTVIHGDCHLKQWYITDDGKMGVGDWQCCTFGNWSRDIAYVLATSLAIDDRRAWERDLLRQYLQVARAKGADCPSFDEAWLLYRKNMVSVLSWWTGTLTPADDHPDMQPQDTSLEFIKRISHAIDDLDAIDACQK